VHKCWQAEDCQKGLFFKLIADLALQAINTLKLLFERSFATWVKVPFQHPMRIKMFSSPI
jgi:hypothetical protein